MRKRSGGPDCAVVPAGLYRGAVYVLRKLADGDGTLCVSSVNDDYREAVDTILMRFRRLADERESQSLQLAAALDTLNAERRKWRELRDYLVECAGLEARSGDRKYDPAHFVEMVDAFDIPKPKGRCGNGCERIEGHPGPHRDENGCEWRNIFW